MYEDSPVYRYIQRALALKGRESELFKIILDVKEVEAMIIQQNTEIQLRGESVDSEGNALFNTQTGSNIYSESDSLGRGLEPYQVFNTGDYFKTFRIEFGDMSITIDSNPDKEGISLFDIYTENIEGLTELGHSALVDLAQRLYVKWYEDNIIQ